MDFQLRQELFFIFVLLSKFVHKMRPEVGNSHCQRILCGENYNNVDTQDKPLILDNLCFNLEGFVLPNYLSAENVFRDL